MVKKSYVGVNITKSKHGVRNRQVGFALGKLLSYTKDVPYKIAKECMSV
jgi:hypothetical protein